MADEIKLLDEGAVLIFLRALFAAHPDPARVIELARDFRTEAITSLNSVGLRPAFLKEQIEAMDNCLSLMSMGLIDEQT